MTESTKYTWVVTHKELVNYLKDKKNDQPGLIRLLKYGGCEYLNDKDAEGNTVPLEEIDPFTFFCYINKYQNRRLEILQKIAAKIEIIVPTDDYGLPSTNPQGVWLFPKKPKRINNEIERLWNFFNAVIDNRITDELFADILKIRGVGHTKLTEVLFYVDPENYFPVNGPSKPYLQEVLKINPSFNSFTEYQDILNKIRNASDKPFFELSDEAWEWNEIHAAAKNDPLAHLIQNYLTKLKTEGDPEEAYKWHAINHFQKYWDIEAENFEEIFLEAFRKKDNLMYQNSWGFISKAVNHFPERVREMFRDLYDESNPVADRIAAFQDAANQILPDLKKAVGKENFNTQQDERTISVYLSFRYPEKYFLYKSSFYTRLCSVLDVKPVISGKRFIHYLELAEAVNEKYIANNPALQEIHSEIYPETTWNADNLITQNFFYIILEKANKHAFSKGEGIAGEKEFLEVIHSQKREDVDNFFEFLDAIFEKFAIKSEDERVVTGTTDKQLNLTIRQRYCWNLYPSNTKKGKFGLISGEPITAKYHTFKGNGPQAFHGQFDDYNVAVENRDKALAAIEKELDRKHKSSFTQHNNAAYRKAIFDKDYRDYILENTEFILNHSEMENIQPELPLNQILYGPPGTGKTYKLKRDYFDKYTVKEASLSKEMFFEETVRDITWWQAIALALLEMGSSAVTDIKENRWVSAKARFSESQNVGATLHGNLQAHAIMDSSTVKYKLRQTPLIFDKNEDKSWKILENELKDQYPELYGIRDSVNDFKPNPEKEIKHYVFTTFHQSFAYEDFIEGIKPKLNAEAADVGYEIENGVFKALCLRAQSDPMNRYAIFIDEINRGNVSAIFGELITLIEPDKRLGAENEIKVKLPYSKTDFGVPSNVDIYGTMNTADRSVEALDTALRRRFSFKEVMPNSELLRDIEFTDFNLQEVLECINERIEFLLDRDHTIGHSYFLDVESEDSEALKDVFLNRVIPLLQEYFYHDYEKIALILGYGFVTVTSNHVIKFPDFSGIDPPDAVTLCRLVDEIDEIEGAIKTLLNRNE